MAWRSKVKRFEALLETYAPDIADAFRESLDDIARRADIKALRAAIAAGDVNGALAALHITEDAFTPFAEAFRRTFVVTGTQMAADIPPITDSAGNRFIIRFGARNPAVEDWLSQHSGAAVQRITSDSRAALQRSLTRAMERGDNPTSIVVDTVGRINRVTGRREGGHLGLTTAQQGYVANAQDELDNLDKGYFDRALRDRRYDRAIKQAMDDGRPVPQQTKDRALVSYRNRLLAYRAKVIGRTEAMQAINKAKHVAFETAILEGKLDPSKVTKIWRSSHDSHVRFTHAVLSGKKAKWGEPFHSPSGAFLQFPMDTSLGAPAEEIIQCRCQVDYDIDFLAGLK